MSNPILLAPGPVQLHPEVQKILSLPMIHHRTPEFDAILKSALKRLQFLFQTQQPVFMQSSTGSGGMESLLTNLLSTGDQILVIVSGKFGERWAEMAEYYSGFVGATAHRLNVDWGKPVNPDDVEKYLKLNPQTTFVLTQATETSTATQHDVQSLAKITSQAQTLLLVDGITAVGAYPLPMDQWKIDGLVGGSQKAVMLPTGMSFVSFSERAWKKAQTAKGPRFYFDLRKEFVANEKGETLFSSNVPLTRALDYVIGRIEALGLEKHLAQIKRRADYTRAMLPYMDLVLYSKAPSDSVTAIALPPVLDGVKLREHLEKKYALTLMGGQDKLKGKILRIGHMGYITDETLHETTIRMTEGLNDFNYQLDYKKIEQASKNWLSQNK